MGIVRNVLSGIDGVFWFPLIALLFFIAFFVVMAIHTWTMKKDRAEELARLPLEEDEEKNNDFNS